MKKLSFYILLLCSGCTLMTDKKNVVIKNAADTIPSLTFPVRQRGNKFLDTVTKKINYGDINLILKYKEGDKSSFIYSANENGQTIDSLALFEQTPYYGTDSHYDPWIEINSDGTIIRTDTSIYQGAYKTSKQRGSKNSIIQIIYDTTITVDKFSVDTKGKFSTLKKSIP